MLAAQGPQLAMPVCAKLTIDLVQPTMPPAQQEGPEGTASDVAALFRPFNEIKLEHCDALHPAVVTAALDFAQEVRAQAAFRSPLPAPYESADSSPEDDLDLPGFDPRSAWPDDDAHR